MEAIYIKSDYSGYDTIGENSYYDGHGGLLYEIFQCYNKFSFISLTICLMILIYQAQLYGQYRGVIMVSFIFTYFCIFHYLRMNGYFSVYGIFSHILLKTFFYSLYLLINGIFIFIIIMMLILPFSLKNIGF